MTPADNHPPLAGPAAPRLTRTRRLQVEIDLIRLDGPVRYLKLRYHLRRFNQSVQRMRQDDCDHNLIPVSHWFRRRWICVRCDRRFRDLPPVVHGERW